VSDAPTTRWTWLLLGRKQGEPRYDEAWRYLFTTYRPVVEAYFRRHAPDPTTALEWCDAFLAAWVEGALDRAAPEVGAFRAYLFTALRHFRLKQQRALGRARVAPMSDALDAVADDEPRDLFERDFARRILELALVRLRRYQEAARSSDNRYHDLVRALYLDAGPERPTLRALGERFGLTEKAVERQLEKARAKLREWLLGELRETVSSDAELAAEVRALVESGGELLSELALP
jgi:RNA polymerase sigma factor (sigma-70 family)